MSDLLEKPFLMEGFTAEMQKIAKVVTPLQPHQQRVVDRIQQDDQPGLVVVHGLGSGKTLTAIAAQDALGKPAEVIVPAALRENYRKEMSKHHKGKAPKVSLDSIQNVATKQKVVKAPMMIVDEAHRVRDPSTAGFQALKANEAQKRLLLTGSPFYNHPADIAPLIDLAADKKVLPFDRDEFTRRYIAEKIVKPSIGQRMLNVVRKPENKVKPGTVPILYERNAPELRDAFAKWVDYHPGSTQSADFPTVERRDVRVPMSKEQLKVYDTLMDKAPAWVAAKVKRGLPPDKKEATQLNAFLSAARQAANTTAPFVDQGTPAEETKIQKAFESLQSQLNSNPRAKAVVYSNFLDAGINPYKRRLDEAKIPYGEFTGEMSQKKRDQLVRDYNAGKIRTLLLSSAGGEGLDLKGTRLMQVLEPHWNDEKLKQVEGRGARFKSHADLPLAERKMLIERYLSTRPEGVSSKVINKIMGRDPDKSTDEYLAQMSKQKQDLIDQFKALLPKEKRSAAKGSSESASTTEASRELAQSLKPRLAATAAYTLPGIASGASFAGLLSGGNKGIMAAGAVLGGVLGQTVANHVTKDVVKDGKILARQALRTASKENFLRLQAGKMNYGEIAKSLGRRSALEVINAGTAAPMLLQSGLRPQDLPKVLVPSAALSIGSAALGSVGTGYLDKYRNMIAVNELDNVRAMMEASDKEKLRRARATVAKLEDKVEGDGWKKAPKDEETKTKSKYDW